MWKSLVFIRRSMRFATLAQTISSTNPETIIRIWTAYGGVAGVTGEVGQDLAGRRPATSGQNIRDLTLAARNADQRADLWSYAMRVSINAIYIASLARRIENRTLSAKDGRQARARTRRMRWLSHGATPQADPLAWRGERGLDNQACPSQSTWRKR